MISYAFYMIYMVECDDCSSMKVALNVGQQVIYLLAKFDITSAIGIHIIDDGDPFVPIPFQNPLAGLFNLLGGGNNNNMAPPMPPPPDVANPQVASLQTLAFMQQTVKGGKINAPIKTVKASDYMHLLPPGVLAGNDPYR